VYQSPENMSVMQVRERDRDTERRHPTIIRQSLLCLGLEIASIRRICFGWTSEEPPRRMSLNPPRGLLPSSDDNSPLQASLIVSTVSRRQGSYHHFKRISQNPCPNPMPSPRREDPFAVALPSAQLSSIKSLDISPLPKVGS
jgi:hypothetical protein